MFCVGVSRFRRDPEDEGVLRNVASGEGQADFGVGRVRDVGGSDADVVPGVLGVDDREDN
jgi:hypothetical protein